MRGNLTLVFFTGNGSESSGDNMLGMMWLDTSTKLSAADNVAQAVAYFTQAEKYHGKRPLQVRVNSGEWPLESAPVVNGLQVVPAKNIPVHHVFVVYEGVN
jgi:hypothetical protein